MNTYKWIFGRKLHSKNLHTMVNFQGKLKTLENIKIAQIESFPLPR